MSVEKFDGNGLADQPSIIYEFEENESGDLWIDGLACSCSDNLGSSFSDMIDWETTNSSLTDSLPGQGDLARNNYRENCGIWTYSTFSSDDPAEARTKPINGSNYLNTRDIGPTQVQQKLKNKRLKKPHTTTSTLTWPVDARRGSRTCYFFGNRNKRLASASGYADCRVPLAGRS